MRASRAVTETAKPSGPDVSIEESGFFVYQPGSFTNFALYFAMLYFSFLQN